MSTLSFDGLFKLMKSRRSVRRFLADPVSQGDLEQLFIAASTAPSGGNKQNWFFIAVKDKAVKEKLLAAVVAKADEFISRIDSSTAKKEFRAYTQFYTFFTQAPVVIAVIKKPYDSLAARIMERYGMANARRSSADIQGPAAAIQNLLLAAHSLGYGACWMTGPMIAKEDLEAILGIEKNDELMALIPVGRPAGETVDTKRKDVKEIYKII